MKTVLIVALGVVLIPFCILHAWTAPAYPSIKPWPSGTENNGPYRPTVDEWAWDLLNIWYANSEDGVSGQQAWIWVNGALVRYPDTFPTWVPAWLIAICWSVWRNNANNYKRAFRTDSLSKVWQAQ